MDESVNKDLTLAYQVACIHGLDALHAYSGSEAAIQALHVD